MEQCLHWINIRTLLITVFILHFIFLKIIFKFFFSEKNKKLQKILRKKKFGKKLDEKIVPEKNVNTYLWLSGFHGEINDV